MSSVRLRENGQWQFIIKNKTYLDQPIYLTFDSKEEGEEIVKRLEANIKQGIVPFEYQRKREDFHNVSQLINVYLRTVSVTSEDSHKLGLLIDRIGSVRIDLIDYKWAESFAKSLKYEHNLAPSTVRKYVECLARAFDWAGNHGSKALINNPLRRLPRGYSTYSDTDKRVVKDSGGVVKTDIERDRRLSPDEEKRILAVIVGDIPEGRTRPVPIEHRPAIWLMFVLALETAMRMREIYTLKREQINLSGRTIFLDKTKNGDKRQVPLTTVAVKAIEEYYRAVEEKDPEMNGFNFEQNKLLPFWNGVYEKRVLTGYTAKISQRFARIFREAKCEDFHFHDLRHEATSRFFERTNLSEARIMKITGHKSHRMMMRYANLRASDLAGHLW